MHSTNVLLFFYLPCHRIFDLLMFVVSRIVLEDSDWNNTGEVYMGQILTIAGSWVSRRKDANYVNEW